MKWVRIICATICVVYFTVQVAGQNSDTSQLTPNSLSPNGRLGVLSPIYKDEIAIENDTRVNQVVELASRRVVARMDAEPGYGRRLNHRGVGVSKWSGDSSTLLWEVSGKWFPYSLVLLKLHEGKEEWQLDLLGTCQKQILSLTKKAAPGRYSAAKKENAGNGSAYPDGFTVDVRVDSDPEIPISLPLKIKVSLTANPKGHPDYSANLDASLEATVSAKGDFKVISFHLEP